MVLLGATLAALVWANADPAGYAATWHTVLVIRSGRWQLADSWQGWVNSGLMAFFLVAGWRRVASSIWANCANGGGWRCRWWSP